MGLRVNMLHKTVILSKSIHVHVFAKKVHYVKLLSHVHWNDSQHSKYISILVKCENQILNKLFMLMQNANIKNGA